jgi:hypothetical protein
MFQFTDIDLTGLTEDQVLGRAQEHFAYMENRFGSPVVTMQEAIETVISSQIENLQG